MYLMLLFFLENRDTIEQALDVRLATREKMQDHVPRNHLPANVCWTAEHKQLGQQWKELFLSFWACQRVCEHVLGGQSGLAKFLLEKGRRADLFSQRPHTAEELLQPVHDGLEAIVLRVGQPGFEPRPVVTSWTARPKLRPPPPVGRRVLAIHPPQQPATLGMLVLLVRISCAVSPCF